MGFYPSRPGLLVAVHRTVGFVEWVTLIRRRPVLIPHHGQRRFRVVVTTRDIDPDPAAEGKYVMKSLLISGPPRLRFSPTGRSPARGMLDQSISEKLHVAFALIEADTCSTVPRIPRFDTLRAIRAFAAVANRRVCAAAPAATGIATPAATLLDRSRRLQGSRRGPTARIRPAVVLRSGAPVIGPRIQERVALRDRRVGQRFILVEPGGD